MRLPADRNEYIYLDSWLKRARIDHNYQQRVLNRQPCEQQAALAKALGVDISKAWTRRQIQHLLDKAIAKKSKK